MPFFRAGPRGYSQSAQCTLIALHLLLAFSTGFAITPDSVELQIGEMAEQHASQQRPELVRDPILNLVARAKALDLGERGYFAHVDPDGYGPNKAASLAGYELPAWWGDANDLNYIESIAAGYADAASAFNGWMNSPGHRRHVLGETDFFAQQTRYGVGYAEVPGSPYQRYYVFISAPPNLAGASFLEPYSEWLFSFYRPAEIDRDNDTSDTNNNGMARIVEFVLGFNPRHVNRLPLPVFNSHRNRLEWHLTIRNDLGSVQVEVEHSINLSPDSWGIEAVERNGSIFSIPASSRGFMRLRALGE